MFCLPKTAWASDFAILKESSMKKKLTIALGFVAAVSMQACCGTGCLGTGKLAALLADNDTSTAAPRITFVSAEQTAEAR